MKNLIIRIVAAVTFIATVTPALAVDCATEIWVCQEYGRNEPDTTGTPDEPFKSTTYAPMRTI